MVVVNSRAKVFRCNSLIFVLLPTIVIVKTNLQTFYLRPLDRRAEKRLKVIRIMMELGEIRNLNELAGWTRPSIIWTSILTPYDISKCKITNVGVK